MLHCGRSSSTFLSSVSNTAIVLEGLLPTAQDASRWLPRGRERMLYFRLLRMHTHTHTHTSAMGTHTLVWVKIAHTVTQLQYASSISTQSIASH